jgi:hypothetical protein
MGVAISPWSSPSDRIPVDPAAQVARLRRQGRNDSCGSIPDGCVTIGAIRGLCNAIRSTKHLDLHNDGGVTIIAPMK